MNALSQGQTPKETEPGFECRILKLTGVHGI